MEVHSAFKGQFCSIEIEKCGHELRTGMVLIGLKCEEIKVKKFKAELWSMINDKDIKLKLSYQPLVHIEHICQCVKLLSTTNTNNNSKDDSSNYITIPNGSSIEVEMEFLYHHEYIKKNSFLIIVDNAIQIYGYVKEIYI
jgi:GTPase